MELRKVEQELAELCSEWKELRRKRPRFGDGAGGADAGEVSLSARMPSWKELKSCIVDDELFPPGEEDVEEKEEGKSDGGADANGVENGAHADAPTDSNGSSNDAPGEGAGYSEFGMCLGGGVSEKESAESNASGKGGGGGSIFERYAAKNTAKAKTVEPQEAKAVASPAVQQFCDGASDDEELIASQDASAEGILASLESINRRFAALGPKVDKFTTKLRERDPVTKKPRYGEKTIPRVKAVIRTHRALERGMTVVFGDAETGPSLVSSLRSLIQQHAEEANAMLQAKQSQEQLEAERIAKERLEAEERANRQRLLEEERKKEEERELARRAEEARLRRLEEEQRALDEERRADDELLALVPTLGEEGVREQIGRMREAMKDDRAALDVALGSMYTLFEQIVRKPEEINFRRVRRDHPKFMEDIGRHVGGREVLIAAGFKLEKLDGVPCFFSKEPHIESDMDGWSAWFDTLKKTLAVIEEEMLK